MLARPESSQADETAFPTSMPLHISVSDSGIGIAQEKQEAIFEAFAQADSGTARKYGGTGLGLAITRDLTALMGGKVWVNSRQGTGTTFHVILPLADAQAPPQTGMEVKNKNEAYNFSSLRVLVAEDNSTNQKLIERLLGKTGARVSLVQDGQEAIDCFRTALDASPFDLILMDCQMPQVDGYDASRNIRQIESERGLVRVPIIALTAHVLPGEEEKCLDAGMDGYSPKPLSREHLFSMMASLTARSTQSNK